MTRNMEKNSYQLMGISMYVRVFMQRHRDTSREKERERETERSRTRHAHITMSTVTLTKKTNVHIRHNLNAYGMHRTTITIEMRRKGLLQPYKHTLKSHYYVILKQ
jgi:hypothetical protein